MFSADKVTELKTNFKRILCQLNRSVSLLEVNTLLVLKFLTKTPNKIVIKDAVDYIASHQGYKELSEASYLTSNAVAHNG